MAQLSTLHFLLALVAGAASSAVLAAEKTFIVGAFEVAPSVKVSLSSDDNIYQSDGNKESSGIVVVNPRLEGVFRRRGSVYSIVAKVANGTYTSSSDDNYTDLGLIGDAHIEINSRNTVDLIGGFEKEHEDRGAGFSQGSVAQSIDKPNEYEDSHLGGKYTFGGAGSRGRVELDAKYLDKQYSNNEADIDTRDRHHFSYGATFYWKVAPKTALLIEGAQEAINYARELNGVNLQTLDSDETKLLVGVTWEATAKTKGTIKFGTFERKFDDNATNTFDETTWEAEIEWRPRVESVFAFKTERGSEEQRGAGTFIDRKLYQVGWAKQWTGQFRSDVTVLIADDSYEGTARGDDLVKYEMGVTYSMRSWLDLTASYAYDERDSSGSSADLDYGRNVFLIGLNFNL